MASRGVLNTRTTVPPVPPRHLARLRLLGALDAAAGARPLTLVAAGPGYGKTALLSKWSSLRETAPTWISLDPADNDPNQFLKTIRTALRPVERRSAAPPPAAVDVDEALAGVLTEYLPLELILDDAHVLTDRAILGGIDGWLRRWAGQLHLVVAARSDPLLPLHRYRLAGSMFELRAADLAMTRSEIKDLLTSYSVQLPDAQLDVLTARTEGWPAGVRLSAMSMEGHEGAEQFINQLAGDEGSIGEYLLDEVLSRQAPEVRKLLVETSFVSEVSADLACAVTGQPDAGEMLAELSRTNSFVIGVGHDNATFRYHQLFGEMLRYLLHREPPEHRHELIRRAAEWYRQDGDVANAVELAALTEDWRYLARMLAHGGFVDAWLAHVPLPGVPAETLLREIRGDDDRDGAALLVAAAAAFVIAGEPGKARAQLDRLPDVMLETTNPELQTAADLVGLLVARSRHRVRDADELAQRLLTTGERTGRPELAAAAEVLRAMTHFYGGAHDHVESLLRSAAARARAADAAGVELDALAQLAHVNAFWGRFRTSEVEERHANALLAQQPGLNAPPTLLLAVAQRAVVRARFALAAKAIRRAASLPADPCDADARDEIAIVTALLAGLDGRLDDALAAVRGIPVGHRGLTREYRLACLAHVELARRRPERALRTLAGAATPPSSIVCTARGAVYLALGDLVQAESALRPVLTASGVPSIRAVLVAALVTQAEIVHRRGDSDGRAAENLVRALELADGEIVLPFVRAYDSLREVIARHPLLADQWPIPQADPVEVGAQARPQLTSDPLTDKERAVLRWLATSMSTTEIAEELGLSVNTVKTHIAAIYRKLAAPRRRDAVLQARRLELL